MVVALEVMLINREEVDHFMVLGILNKILPKPTATMMFIGAIIPNM